MLPRRACAFLRSGDEAFLDRCVRFRLNSKKTKKQTRSRKRFADLSRTGRVTGGKRMLALLRPIASLNTVILRLARQIAWMALAVMVLVILAQVFFRYVLNNALPWPDEAARFLMLWMTALMAPSAMRWAWLRLDRHAGIGDAAPGRSCAEPDPALSVLGGSDRGGVTWLQPHLRFRRQLQQLVAAGAA